MLQSKDRLNGYKNNTCIYAVCKRFISYLNICSLQVRRWRKVTYTNRNQNKAGVAIAVSDKIDFKPKTETRDKKGKYITIKETIQEDISIVYVYAANKAIPKYIKQIFTNIRGGMDNSSRVL